MIGKFLNGDPFIADPVNGQNYNRYSYVLNNPMNSTDVTGFVKDPDSGCMSCDWTIVSGSMPDSAVVGMILGIGPNGSNVLIFADGHVGFGSVNLNGYVTGYQAASIAQVNAAIQSVVGSTPQAQVGATNKQNGGAESPHCTDGVACVTIVGHREESTPFKMPYGTPSQIIGDFFDPVAPIARGMGATENQAMIADFAVGLLMGGSLKNIASTGFSAVKKTAYSVAFEMKLAESSFPGVSRARHFQEANEALLKAVETDPAFSKIMEQLGISVERTPTGLAPRNPPPGWTWHHAEEDGLMQLVPRDQHTIGSDFWDVLHQDGRGGYSIWGK